MLGGSLATTMTTGIGGVVYCTEIVDTSSNGLYGLGPAVVVTESQDSLQQHSGGGGNKIRLLKGTIFDGLITLYILCNCLL